MAAGDVKARDEVLGDETLVDGHHVAHAVARVNHHAREEPLRIQRQHGLDAHVHLVEPVRLEHVLAQLLAVLSGRKGRG